MTLIGPHLAGSDPVRDKEDLGGFLKGRGTWDKGSELEEEEAVAVEEEKLEQGRSVSFKRLNHILRRERARFPPSLSLLPFLGARAMELDYVKNHCFKTHLTLDDPLWRNWEKLMLKRICQSLDHRRV